MFSSLQVINVSVVGKCTRSLKKKMKKAHTTSGMTTSFPYVSFAMVMVVISALALAKRSALDAAILLNIFGSFVKSTEHQNVPMRILSIFCRKCLESWPQPEEKNTCHLISLEYQ
jgi:cyanate permease